MIHITLVKKSKKIVTARFDTPFMHHSKLMKIQNSFTNFGLLKLFDYVNTTKSDIRNHVTSD